MTKEEFKERYAAIMDRISALNAERMELIDEYIRTNSPYKVGMKVRVGKRVGILVGYECRNSEVYPVVSKMKKDGTSHPSARYWGYALSEVKAIE